MRKYTYILQTHNPDKKYIVDNIIKNIGDDVARKSTLSTMLRHARGGWLRMRYNEESE